VFELNADRNVLVLFDKLSGEEMEFYYRMPTNDERVKYDSAMTKRKGTKIVVNKEWPLLQAKFGAALLTGFKKGCFAVDGKAISSDQTDADYLKGWKTLLFQKRPDLLGHVARTVFSAAAQADASIELEDLDAELEDLENPDFAFEDADAETASPGDATATEPVASPLSGQ